MRNVVADKSSYGYCNHIINFFLWIYDNDELREVILRDWMVEMLHVAKREDDGEHGTKKKRINQRAVCKEAINSIVKGDGDTYPILLEKLTFNIFSHYLSTKKKKNGNYLSKESYGGIRSALVHLFRLCGKTIDDSFAKNMSEFMSGIQRKLAKQKAESGVSLEEGKKPMSFAVYNNCVRFYTKGMVSQGLTISLRMRF